MPFLTLSQPLQKALQEAGFTQPTPIQERVIPLVLQREDVMARAQTGSGKSAAFVLPILELLSASKGEGKAKIKALILTPTRELTLQVAEVFETFGSFLHVKPKVVSVIGGEKIGEQLYAIQQGCDVVVATSGRLLDVMSKKQMNLAHVEFFVLDEADKMLDLGFEQELSMILEALPSKRQNLLFSATYPEKVQQIVTKITENAREVSIEGETPTIAHIIQRAIEVNKENRSPLLRALIREHKWKRVIVFMANKRACENSAEKFRKHGFDAEAFHGDLVQEGRVWALQALKEGKVSILFATDIAARGLHIQSVDCVVNFDLPRSPLDYVHRIGRTGRAGEAGLAISFIDFEDEAHFLLIQKRCQVVVLKEQIQGFERVGDAPKKEKGSAPIKGKRKSKKDKLREQAQA